MVCPVLKWWNNSQLVLEKKFLDDVQAAPLTVEGWNKNLSFFQNVKNLILANDTHVIYTDDQIEDLISSRRFGSSPSDLPISAFVSSRANCRSIARPGGCSLREIADSAPTREPPLR